MPWLASASAFALSLVLSLAVRATARRLGLVAQPRPDRWHRRPTALFGGIAIALGFAGPVLLLGTFGEVWPVLALALPLLLVGLADDLHRLPPGAKLVFQIVAAAGALYFGYRLGWTGSITVDSVLTFVWLVGLANAFNLLDNMDGLAAGVAAIAAAAYLALSITHGAPSDALMFGALLGSTAGFLVLNFQPASLFMGDTGSLFLGFTIALLSIKLGPGLGTGGASAVIIPVAVLSVPIFDTTFVTFVRSLAGRRISVGGRDHSSHRLVALGLPEREAVLVLYACACVAAAAGLSVFYLGLSHANILVGAVLVALTFFGVHLGQVRVYDAATTPPGPGNAVAVVLRRVTSRTRLLDLALDIGVITLAYYTAYRLRFSDFEFQYFFPIFARSLPVVVAVTVTSFWLAGAYRGIWKYFGTRDAIVLLQGTALATVSSVAAMSYLFRFEGYSRAVFLVFAALAFVMLSVGRASFRLVHDFTGRVKASGRRVVIYGAGDAGLAALRLARGERLAVHVIGFIDDNPEMHTRSVQGVRVLGGFDTLLAQIAGNGLDGVLISSASIDAARLESVREACRQAGAFLLRYRAGFEDLLAGDGRPTPTAVRLTGDEDEVYFVPTW
jgi:UDP-GlcNAc:undecaprenyl-phosphate/decaprenyl-phosphate GlcNAc-1-phosphate transferase